MILSYCLKYLKDFEWHIEVLRVGSEKYIISHGMFQLEKYKDQLINCHKNIIVVKIKTK